MSTYIVRVQLNNGTIQNYTRLKNALVQVGFTKKITAKTGVDYILPNGNYLGESERTKDEILDIVLKTAMRIDASPMILVTEAKPKGNSWYGLALA